MFGTIFGNKNIVGIDVSSFSIKLMEFRKSGKNVKIEHAGIVALSEGCVVNSKIVKSEEVASKLNDLVQISGTSTKNAAFAISGGDTISKITQFPEGSTDEDILNLINTYPEQYISYPIEGMAIDLRILGENDSAPDLVDVIITCAKYEDISTIIDVASDAGLSSKIIDVSTYTLENIFPMLSSNFPDYGKNKTIAVIDIGAMNTNLCVFDNGSLTFAKVANFGGKKLTDDIMSKYGVSYGDAGRLKKQGGLPDNYENELLNPFKEDVINHIGRLLKFYYTSNHVETVDYISLAGGCSGIEGLADLTESRLGISCGITDPFTHLPCSPRVSKKLVQNNGSALLVAGSLALRAFD